MGVTYRNRNLDTYSQERSAFVDNKGRAVVNTGLDGDVYTLFLQPIAAGANKVHMDFFNATTDKDVEILSVQPIMSGAVAVVGALAVDLYLTRTTAVGTGGTAATLEGTALNAPTISKLDPASPALPATITARSAPGGGATAGAVLAFESIFPEETNTATYFRNNLIKDNHQGSRIIVPPSTGIRVVQGAVASVGNLGFTVLFSVLRRDN
jgi:hypothetical protein